jgi:hypothetical protein
MGEKEELDWRSTICLDRQVRVAKDQIYVKSLPE